MSTKEKKESIREKLLARRKSIPEEKFLQKSEQICSRLKALPEFQQAGVVHCYVSINPRREVNTHPLIRQMLAGEKSAVVPITQIEEGTFRNVKLNSFDDLKENVWDVLEPAGGEEVSVKELDLVIVPMVAGDRRKNRIGYGKGFYDRFLKDVACPAVGLLFEECLIHKVPVEPFDVPLTKVVTEKQVID